MPGQQRRGQRPAPGTRTARGTGATRSTGTGGARGSGTGRASGTVRSASDQASQPRSARVGAPRTPAGRGAARTAPARPAARPAGARRTTGTTTGRRPSPPNRLTGRATVLVLVLGALLLAYAYPVRIYLNQQAEIAALRAHQRQQQAHIADLQAESAKWNDPAYVEAQARSRLQMGRPGETLYIVVDGDTPTSTDPNAGKVKNTGPWYGQLWSSLTAADQPKQTK